MPHTVNREDLLAKLEAVTPGLSTRDIAEQFNCFAVRDGWVFTFNDEVSCRTKTKLPKELVGAVRADKCLDILRRLPEDELAVEVRDGDLTFKGKGRRAGLRLEAEVLLPVDSVPLPETWRELPAEFGEAAGTVARCASRDQSSFASTCVHLHPEWLEASDDTQVCRWPLAVGLKNPVLIRASSLQHAATLGASACGVTKGWLHFKGAGGLVMSCRRYADEYPDLAKPLEVGKGAVPVTFPKGVAEECERSDVFSSENPDNNLVKVEMRPGRLRVRADGVSGWFAASRKLDYKGPSLSFLCPPQLLIDLVKRANECLVTADRIWVKATGYTWMSCLSVPEENETEERSGDDAE